MPPVSPPVEVGDPLTLTYEAVKVSAIERFSRSDAGITGISASNERPLSPASATSVACVMSPRLFENAITLNLRNTPETPNCAPSSVGCPEPRPCTPRQRLNAPAHHSSPGDPASRCKAAPPRPNSMSTDGS